MDDGWVGGEEAGSVVFGMQCAAVRGRPTPSDSERMFPLPAATVAADPGSSSWVGRMRPGAGEPSMSQPPILLVHEGGDSRPEANGTERLRAAAVAVMNGYQEAVDILSPGPGRACHAGLQWFEEGLCDLRELVGLPRVRVLEDAPRMSQA